MRVVNEATDAVIPDVRHMDTALKRFLGLRFRAPGRAFFSFPRDTTARFDMLFVRGPIDVAFCDSDMVVRELHGAHPVTLAPETWRTYAPDEPYRYVLETEKGLLTDRGFAPGQQLRVHD